MMMGNCCTASSSFDGGSTAQKTPQSLQSAAVTLQNKSSYPRWHASRIQPIFAANAEISCIGSSGNVSALNAPFCVPSSAREYQSSVVDTNTFISPANIWSSGCERRCDVIRDAEDACAGASADPAMKISAATTVGVRVRRGKRSMRPSQSRSPGTRSEKMAPTAAATTMGAWRDHPPRLP
jgi:hypothetical protein